MCRGTFSTARCFLHQQKPRNWNLFDCTRIRSVLFVLFLNNHDFLSFQARSAGSIRRSCFGRQLQQTIRDANPNQQFTTALEELWLVFHLSRSNPPVWTGSYQEGSFGAVLVSQEVSKQWFAVLSSSQRPIFELELLPVSFDVESAHKQMTVQPISGDVSTKQSLPIWSCGECPFLVKVGWSIPKIISSALLSTSCRIHPRTHVSGNANHWSQCSRYRNPVHVDPASHFLEEVWDRSHDSMDRLGISHPSWAYCPSDDQAGQACGSRGSLVEWEGHQGKVCLLLG